MEVMALEEGQRSTRVRMVMGAPGGEGGEGGEGGSLGGGALVVWVVCLEVMSMCL